MGIKLMYRQKEERSSVYTHFQFVVALRDDIRELGEATAVRLEVEKGWRSD
jgi:hypothetical protein